MIYVYAALSMGILGLVFGLALGGAAKVFEVKTDHRIEEIVNVLPGANCGACGYPGCNAFATAVVEGRAKGNACVVGGASVTGLINDIMGEKLDAPEPKVARVSCLGTKDNITISCEYTGNNSCAAAMVSGGGGRLCAFGCLGVGDCVKACAFGAMVMGEDGLPRVNESLCTACGKCALACPRNLITLKSFKEPVIVSCMSRSIASEAKKVCLASCIGCGICEKNCPHDAIKVVDHLARIDGSKCTACGVCVEKCPKHCIKLFGPYDNA